jgi:hypothetical protein
VAPSRERCPPGSFSHRGCFREEQLISDPKLKPEQRLRQALSEVLHVRARLVKLIEERSQQGTDWPGSSTLEAARAKLERLAAEMQWALEVGLAQCSAGSDSDPEVLLQLEEVHRQLIDVSIRKLDAVIGELSGDEEPEPGHVN